MKINTKLSGSTLRNREPLLEQLKQWITPPAKVLEMGSGSGQHGVFFTQNMDGLVWQTSDLLVNHSLIKEVVAEAKSEAVLEPLEFEVGKVVPEGPYDAVFTANTFHIMPESLVAKAFEQVGGLLPPKGLFLIYGPFKYDEEFTSESNAYFNQKLKSDDPVRGIRDFEVLRDAAQDNGFKLVKDSPMPANNQFIVFEKK